jgi:hypothetical protein
MCSDSPDPLKKTTTELQALSQRLLSRMKGPKVHFNRSSDGMEVDLYIYLAELTEAQMVELEKAEAILLNLAHEATQQQTTRTILKGDV